GGFEGFKKQFAANAAGIQGSGWSVLAWDSLGQRLNVFQLFDQQANVPLGQIPVLQLDMWEHAFYLQYKNVKADYVTAWWNVVNWADVEARLAAARKQTTGLVGCPHPTARATARVGPAAPRSRCPPGQSPFPGRCRLRRALLRGVLLGDLVASVGPP